MSTRSNLIDITYYQLHSALSGNGEGLTQEQLIQQVLLRADRLTNVSTPFGSPSAASRKQVESGSVTLPDTFEVTLEKGDKELCLAISDRFQIDEIQAVILLRSFLYNEGLPPYPGPSEGVTLMDELVEAITPFYFSERLSLLRVLIPLFRANMHSADPVRDVAEKVLPELFPDGSAFTESLISEYVRKTQQQLPANVSTDPRKASRWAKQNSKEQLVMLEVLFWCMWGLVSCHGPLVVRIFEVGYDVQLGSKQENSTLLLDEEGLQLQQDCAAIWMLIMLEILELEQIGAGITIPPTTDPDEQDVYYASPESLKRIHELVVSHGDAQYACIYAAWAFVLLRMVQGAADLKSIPDDYASFFGVLSNHNTYSKDRDPLHRTMARICFQPDVGLFKLIHTLLTNSPVFVTTIAWKAGSTITDPNAVAFRSVMKGLVMALVELSPVELMPDFDSFVEVWIALFGRSEIQSVAGICHQFWEYDWSYGIARRAIFDVARSRFPVQFNPLIRLLRAMTAAGFLSIDPLSPSESHEDRILSPDQESCKRYVFNYLNQLPTYSQIIPMSSCSGPHALYEKVQERYGSPGLTYVTYKPTRLPGGSTLPARSVGRLMSGDGGDHIAIAWQHEHSGWKVLLEVLTDYVNQAYSGGAHSSRNRSIGTQSGPQPVTFRLPEIGVEMNDRDEAVVTNVLDLLHSVMQDNPVLAQELLESLEIGDPVVEPMMTSSQPDLVQLTTMILEDALARTNIQARISLPAPLITSAMSVLSALLPIHRYSNRVWLYIRSTPALFGSGRAVGSVAAALAAERITGQYTMTLSLLYLVQQLFCEATSSILTVLPGNPKLQQVKEEVLLRAVRFVHSEIWVEHLGWKYGQLGDKFEIGRRITSLYADILQHAPYLAKDRPFSALSQAIADLLLFKATTSTVNPLVTSITTSGSTLGILSSGRRLGDARRVVFLLESHLRLAHLILNMKQTSTMSTQLCLLEQMLCSPVSGGANIVDPNRSKVDPIDVLAGYVKSRDIGNVVPQTSVNVLHALCSSLSSSQMASAIISHLSDPEATVISLIRIVQHPYDEPALRNAVWNFITLAVDREPALARLFVDGQFRFPVHYKGKGKGKGKEKEKEAEHPSKMKPTSTLDVAREIVSNWRSLLDLNPQILASVLRFLDVVWQHGLEHTTALGAIRDDVNFWEQLAAIVSEELGPMPDYKTETNVIIDGVHHSHLHEAIALHSYRTLVKSYALHVIGLDIGIQLQSWNHEQPPKKPLSYAKTEAIFSSEEQLTDLVSEAAPSPHDPQLHDELMQHINTDFQALSLDEIRSQAPLVEREPGDDFVFTISVLQTRLHPFRSDYSGDSERTANADVVERLVQSINLNLSLTHAQTSLAESWHFFLRQVIPFLRTEKSVRSTVLSIATSVSYDIASEKRLGDAMATIHGTRLSLLLALLEVVWFSESDSPKEIQSFIELVHNVRQIILSESQPPAQSFLGKLTVPFHRTLLQIVYFCSRQARSLERRAKVLNADQRLTIASMHDAALTLVIDALRLVFDTARSRLDIEVDRDMELLVAVFEQCTRPEVNSSPVAWLSRCQETDVIRASLELFVNIDLVGLSDLPFLLARRRPLYAPHILMFHIALTSIWSAAERVASAGILVAYRNNCLTPAISAGTIDVTLPELPGERSPAHRVYCSMLAVVAGLIGSLGRQNHFFDAEASGFVQLYGDQISRALSWTISDPLTFPLLEEIEQIVNLFYAIAESAPTTGQVNPAVEKVLRVFSRHALLLLQQLTYALTHPNHLASVIEPITAEDRSLIEKDVSQSSSDPMTRPLIARMVHRLLTLSYVITCTLISISRADRVLIGQEDDWPMHEALIVPHSKVVLGEPASVGTLLELGNCTLDILQDLVGKPTNQLIASSLQPESNEQPLEVRQATLIARQTLEAVFVYGVTQLAMWVSKPEPEISSGDVDIDDQAMEPQKGDPARDRKAAMPSLTLADRLRMRMTGEIGADLQALLTKAKPIIAKSEAVVGTKVVDLTQVLSNFLRERVVTPT